MISLNCYYVDIGICENIYRQAPKRKRVLLLLETKVVRSKIKKKRKTQTMN
ncbi:hypothetical protein ACJX0J_008387, partial [Zea mays]